jgi:hypothetical protein
MRSTLLTIMAISFLAWFLGTLAAILLYAPLMTVVTVSAIVLASLIMFSFGVVAGQTIRTRPTARHWNALSSEQTLH